MQTDKAYDLMMDTILRMQQIGSAISLLSWDNDTIRPPAGAEARARVIGSLAAEAFRLGTAPAYGEALAALAIAVASDPERYDILSLRILEEEVRSFSRFSRIPVAEYETYQTLTALARSVWTQAKQENDFSRFESTLTEIVSRARDFSAYWGYVDKPYDGHLAGYDPDMLGAEIDPVFAALAQGTRQLMDRLPEPAPPLAVHIEPEKQQELALYLLGEIGYDLSAGNLYTTEHPFTSRIHSGDVRVTTHYYPDQPASAIFSVLHEGGHGIYEQNISAELDGTNMHQVLDCLHESQSRFFENIIGRSRAFWEGRFQTACRIVGTPLADSAESLWRSVNAMRPSLIRIEADELTYNLHIIIRYELERALFNEGLEVRDLPEAWRQKYSQYLGVTPPDDATGVLQDIHWSAGYFGYFPAYAIGNLIAAQLAAAIARELGSLDQLLVTAEGLTAVRAWLNQKVHRLGAVVKPADLLLGLTGESLDARHFLSYMEDKIAALS